MIGQLSCDLLIILQVLGKSAKPIPVLIFGVLLGRKHYPAIKYLIVLLIVVGVAVFLYRSGNNREAATTEAHTWRLFNFLGLGELLVVSLHDRHTHTHTHYTALVAAVLVSDTGWSDRRYPGTPETELRHLSLSHDVCC